VEVTPRLPFATGAGICRLCATLMGLEAACSEGDRLCDTDDARWCEGMDWPPPEGER
jgi:hypothetical protein